MTQSRLREATTTDVTIDAMEKRHWDAVGLIYQAGIFPENKASIALHASLAFALVGTRRCLGKMTLGPLMGQWRDELLLARRSSRAGID